MPAFPAAGGASLDPLLGLPDGLRDRSEDIAGLPAPLDHQTTGLPYRLALRLAVGPGALALGVEESGGFLRLVLGEEVEALRDDRALVKPERVDSAEDVAGKIRPYLSVRDYIV